MTFLASDPPAPPLSQPLPGPAVARGCAWGVVLCGGRSRRMGTDKGALLLGGSTLVARAAAVLAGVGARVLLASGSAPRYPELGLECVLDAEAGLGPLAGLAAALERLQRERVELACVLACDMPRVGPEVFARLLDQAQRSGAEVCLLASPAGLEPLCGVYRVSVLAAVRAALARGARRMDAFHGAVRVTTVDTAELAPGCALNLNTPADLWAEAEPDA